MRTAIWLAAVLGCSAAGLSQQPPDAFELLLPDHSDHGFGVEASTIQVSPRPLQTISIQVLEPAARDIAPSSYQVRLNGKGIGSVFDNRANSRGRILLMDAATLRMRPDQLFDARENSLEISAVDRGGKRYYQNWVLRTNEPGRNELFANTTAMAAGDQAGVPPDLVLSSPAEPPVIGLQQKTVRVLIKGMVSAGTPGTLLTIQGRPVPTPKGQSSASFEQDLVVGRDTREIIIEAVDKAGNRRSTLIPVIAEQTAPAPVKFLGRRYALMIGISDHGKQPGAPPLLPVAAPSARELALQLESRAQFPKGNIRLLMNEQATADQIRSELRDFAASPRADDMLVIYIAGYGVHDPRNPAKLYLATYGTRLQQMDTTAIEFSELEMLLNKNVRCNNTLLVFDVGHALAGEWQFSGRNLFNRYLLNLFSEQEGRAVLVASGTDQVSRVRCADGSSAGLFSYWLLEGLAGRADVNRDRVVTAEELFRFVAEKVRAESGGEQSPRFRIAGKPADMPISAAGASR